MEPELELELSAEEDKTQERIKNLSSKVKDIATERDTEKSGREAAEKERDFYQGFTDMVPKYSAASEHKDAIKEKVMAGYTIEDATVAVLNAQGKLQPQAPAPVVQAPAAGGSAMNPPMEKMTKSVSEMNLAEMRAELLKAQDRGELGLN